MVQEPILRRPKIRRIYPLAVPRESAVQSGWSTDGSILSFLDRAQRTTPPIAQLLRADLPYRVRRGAAPVFTDAVVGGGTSVGVGPEMGIEAHWLDLHSDFNILSARS